MIRQTPLTCVPTEIGRADQHDVRIVWSDGHESVYPARELRLACPCSGCAEPARATSRQFERPAATSPSIVAPLGDDEMTGNIRILPAHIPNDVHPLKINLVGRYAIQIDWSDGHHTGIYSFDLLRKLCPCCCQHDKSS